MEAYDVLSYFFQLEALIAQ